MLYFIITWLFLIGACFSIGTAVVNRLKADCFDSQRRSLYRRRLAGNRFPVRLPAGNFLDFTVI